MLPDPFKVLDRVLNHLAATNASLGAQIRRRETPNPVQVQTLLELQRELAECLDTVVHQMRFNPQLLTVEQEQAFSEAVQTFLLVLLQHRLNEIQQSGDPHPFVRLIDEVHGASYRASR